jgi:hypothetical protein
MSEVKASRILVLTLAIGADYRKKLEKALQSKRDYCARHGYEYLEVHEEGWNRDRPISWSKVLLYQKYAAMSDKYDYIWASDADIWITNPALRLEDHVLPLLPFKDHERPDLFPGKDLLMTYDSCQHVNAGSMVMRCTPWVVDFFKRVWEETDAIYHIWWENKAICNLMARNPSDVAKIEITMEAYRMNAYLRGFKGTRQWQPGDFLVHFAGVYEPGAMVSLMEQMERGLVPRLPM